MKELRLLSANFLVLIAINLGIPIRIRTIEMHSECDRYVIYQTFWN